MGTDVNPTPPRGRGPDEAREFARGLRDLATSIRDYAAAATKSGPPGPTAHLVRLVPDIEALAVEGRRLAGAAEAPPAPDRGLAGELRDAVEGLARAARWLAEGVEVQVEGDAPGRGETGEPGL